MGKQRVRARIEPSGVGGRGARGQISRGTWETRRSGEEATRPKVWPGRHNRQGCSAGDFVVLGRYLTPNRRGWIEEKLETWMGLEINREKTRVVHLTEKQAHLDFLGYTLRYDRDRKGRGHRYLNIVPSKKALQREQNRLRAMTGYSQSPKPLPRLIAELNRHLKGWGGYFSLGRPRSAYGKINIFVLCRLYRHVGRRSQRPFRPPQGKTHTPHFLRMGLQLLAVPRG